MNNKLEQREGEEIKEREKGICGKQEQSEIRKLNINMWNYKK
jgi:hypothetical protein